jgi:arylamine N-acetyltransferase
MHVVDGHTLFDGSEINAYLERLKLSHLMSNGVWPTPNLETLSLLQRRHMSLVPFENLSLHYNTHPGVSIKPEDIFKKICSPDATRGGYCYELALAFCILLRSLGYQVTTGAAKVYDHKHNMFGGNTHMVLIVHLEDEFGKPRLFLSDVTFGPMGPMVPLPLESGDAFPAIGDAQNRLIRKSVPELARLEDMYLVQYKDCMADFEATLKRDTNDENPANPPANGTKPQPEWKTLYAFGLQEFTTADYEIMNYYTCTSRKRWPVFRVFAYKISLDNKDTPSGYMWLNQDTVISRAHNEAKQTAHCRTEKDRIWILQQAFKIRLSEAEIQAIRNLPSELLP